MYNPNQNAKATKIGVVLTDPEDWTARAFVNNIENRGAKPVPLNLATLSASVSTSDFSIFNADLNELELDALIVRDVGISFALEQISFKFDLLQQLETSMPIMNSSEAIQNAANKFLSFYRFKQAQLPIPRTLVTAELDVALKAVDEWGSAVVKPIFGSQGKEIVKLESTRPNLKSNLEAILKKRGVLYVQAFVPNPGRDIRVFVVGEEALGAMYRVSVDDSFVSNLSQGGTPVACEVTAEMEKLAVRATQSVGADFAGVDLIEGEDGLMVLEVNGTPSGRGINQACGIDVTERIVDLLFERLEVDEK
jgi:tetrahydromethanopterin:alpha-L-glutamate ligase